MAGWQPPGFGNQSTPGSAMSGWQDAPTEFKQRCSFTSIYGPESGGKTTLALTAPGPMAVIHAAEKINGVVQPFKNGVFPVSMQSLGLSPTPKNIKMFNMLFVASKDIESTRIAGQALWTQTESLYLDAMNNWAKTMIIDTESDAWMLRRFAKFGTLNPQGRVDQLYNEVNFDWRQLLKNKFRKLADDGRGVNLITIHTSSEEYKDIPNGMGGVKSIRTGKMKRNGHKELAFWADVILWAYKSMEDFQYHVRIDKGWFNGAVEGMDLTNPMMQQAGYSGLNWPAIMALITSTPEFEWLNL